MFNLMGSIISNTSYISQGNSSSLGNTGSTDINSILVYNIACMSYQTQQYGQSLLYLKLLIENLDQVEEFIQVKTLFLCLQILFELKMAHTSKPIMDLLDLKLREIEKAIEQKQQIKSPQNTLSAASQDGSKTGEEKQSQPPKESGTGQQEQSDKNDESKSWTTQGSIYEALDESIMNKNSFCIIIGAFIRKHAVSPKTVNLQELSLLLNSYKAMFTFLGSGNSTREGESFITKAFDSKGKFTADPVLFKEEINMTAVAQHLGMLTHLKAWSFVKQNAIHKCMKTLWIEDQETHPTCSNTPKTDDISKDDVVYKKCNQSHPQFYFNNMGLVHLKLKKYKMAVYYLSKAIKFLEKSNDKMTSNVNIQTTQTLNPNENVGNSVTQKSYEIVFNYGLALYKSQKYYEAFKCFEKVSLGAMKQNPKLWYYMGLCAISLNKELYLQSDKAESDVYHHQLGYDEPPQFDKKQQGKRLTKRFLLAPQGDPISKMENLIKDFEQTKIKEQKKSFVDVQKQLNQDQMHQLSKTK